MENGFSVRVIEVTLWRYLDAMKIGEKDQCLANVLILLSAFQLQSGYAPYTYKIWMGQLTSNYRKLTAMWPANMQRRKTSSTAPYGNFNDSCYTLGIWCAILDGAQLNFDTKQFVYLAHYRFQHMWHQVHCHLWLVSSVLRLFTQFLWISATVILTEIMI